MEIIVKSRKLGREVRFVTQGAAGYVFVDPNGLSWGKQVFDRHGNAAVAKTEDQLRAVAKAYLRRIVAI